MSGETLHWSGDDDIAGIVVRADVYSPPTGLPPMLRLTFNGGGVRAVVDLDIADFSALDRLIDEARKELFAAIERHAKPKDPA